MRHKPPTHTAKNIFAVTSSRHPAWTMSVTEYDGEERERVVDETLGLIDHLDVAQARSILRCVAIDEENFDTHALAVVAKTVRATCDRSQCDYDASVHFPDWKTARLKREHLLNSKAASAEAERAVSADPRYMMQSLPSWTNL